ncbi:MAG: HEAT repeat domain-containing protein [Ktedonobacteraceae bacterium]|nr:HEAT repeat domain-containing protein [Ktedonobacteraceae bacterium]
MAEIHSQRLIPKNPKDTPSDMYYLATSNDWTMLKRVKADAEQRVPHEVIWQTGNKQSTVHYVEDDVVQFPYVFIRGGTIEAVLDVIRTTLTTYTDEELLELFRAATTSEAKKQALAYLGVGAPVQASKDFFAQFQTALADDDPDVRQAALVMMAYPSWPELRPLLEDRRDNDSDSAVRHTAAAVLAAFDQVDIP